MRRVPRDTPHVVLATARSYPLTPSDALLGEELERRGARVTAEPWDTISPATSNGALVVLRSTWDYHRRSREFRHWIQAWDGKPAALWNPPATVLWNMDKIYLRDLADRGVTLPPTRWTEPSERADVDGFLALTGAAAAVIKPRISATAWGTRLLDSGADLEGADATPLESSGAIIQAFVPEIQTRGELSLVYVDGRFGHAVQKRPAAGDFRVQSEFGGGIEPCEVGDEERAFGEAVLAAAPHPWLYARVDLVQTADGPVLMELELIEPSLFFELGPGRESAAALAEAILRSVGDPNPVGTPSAS
jgi:glutathione synthase/RimK-type ligase-like ATP-grasp enzyme